MNNRWEKVDADWERIMVMVDNIVKESAKLGEEYSFTKISDIYRELSTEVYRLAIHANPYKKPEVSVFPKAYAVDL